MKQRQWNWVRYGLWFCFVLALLSSWSHVKWAFSLLESGSRYTQIVPILAATAVDGGIFVIAYAIQQRRNAGVKTFWLWFGICVFSIISIFANWLHGQSVVYGPAYLEESGLQSVISFVFSAPLPLLVVYLGEIVSSTDATIVAQAEKKEKALKRSQSRSETMMKQKIQSLQQEVSELQQRLLDTEQCGMIDSIEWNKFNPKAEHTLRYMLGFHETMEEAATAAGVSKSTVSRLSNSLNGVSE